MIIGVDIDGTLCDPQKDFLDLTIKENEKYYSIAIPRRDIIKKVNELSKENTINIITARSSCFRKGRTKRTKINT